MCFGRIIMILSNRPRASQCLRTMSVDSCLLIVPHNVVPSLFKLPPAFASTHYPFFCIQNAKGKESQGWNVMLLNLPGGIPCSSIYFALQKVPTNEKG